MTTYIALFRGINVGGKNILPMKNLVKILESTGCVEVQTYLQSGNAIFKRNGNRISELKTQLRLRIKKLYGFEPEILILDLAEFKTAIDNNPFDTQDGNTLHFFFLDSQPKYPNVDKLIAIKSKSEEFKLLKKVFYLFAPEGFGRSKLAAQAEKCLGVSSTARNRNTVSKLVELASR